MVSAVTHPPLRPRPVIYSPTLEQQQADFARARRKALHAQLHDLFLSGEPCTEDVFGGKMNLPPERSESETGCSLTHPFVSWLETHEVPDQSDARHRRLLFAALSRLAHERPDISLVIVEHSRSHTPLRKLAERWHRGTDKIGQEFAEGLNLILEWLGDSSGS